MKKHIIAAAISLPLAFSAAAADGTINFTGNITDAACTVNASSSSQTVNLGTISSKTFSDAGVAASPVLFSIVLESCPESVSTASVTFDGVINTTNSNLLALSSGSTATGIGVGIYESDSSTLIPMTTHSAAKTLSSTDSNTLNFVAKYVATSSAVTAGSANAATDFTIVYN